MAKRPFRYPLIPDDPQDSYRAVFGELRELNGLFLALLGRLARPLARGGPVLGLPADLAERLAGLSPARRAELACCPYALFGIRSADRAFWSSVAEQRLPTAYAGAPQLGALREECLSLSVAALGCAWHLCRSSRWLAGLAFGLSPSIRGALLRTPLAFLHRVVARNPALITTRLAEHPCFWSDLILAAESGAAGPRLDAARLAGLHLIAAALSQHHGV